MYAAGSKETQMAQTVLKKLEDSSNVVAPDLAGALTPSGSDVVGWIALLVGSAHLAAASLSWNKCSLASSILCA